MLDPGKNVFLHGGEVTLPVHDDLVGLCGELLFLFGTLLVEVVPAARDFGEVGDAVRDVVEVLFVGSDESLPSITESRTRFRFRVDFGFTSHSGRNPLFLNPTSNPTPNLTTNLRHGLTLDIARLSPLPNRLLLFLGLSFYQN